MSYCSLLDLLKDKYIIIPSYQRDYTQGRDDKKSEEVRTLFVKSIVSAICENRENRELFLDYVYGYEKDDKLYLIDGQQRVTTLFLFYVYAASKSKEKTAWLKNFCYEEREGVTEYIQSKLNGKKSKIEENLHLSPTAEAMERVYRLIETEMYGKDISFEALEKINFLVFSNKNEKSINEKTFWKMNARGKSLTEAEIFKSKACNYLKEKKEEKKIDSENFSRAFNVMYLKLFREQEKDIIKAEEVMLKYIKSFFILGSKDKTEISLDSYTPFDCYKNEASFRSFDDCLDTLINFFNNYDGNKIKDSLPSRMNRKVDDGLYGPIVSWFNNEKKKIDDNFKKYIRIIVNIIDNSSDSIERREFIYNLSCCDDPYTYVCDCYKLEKGINFESAELKSQVEDEREKIEAIKGCKVSEDVIKYAENFSFSYGSIPFLFPVDRFYERKRIYEEFFAPSKENNNLLDESKLKIAIKTLVKSTYEQKELCDVFFFDKKIGKDCGWRKILHSELGKDLLDNIEKDERGENIKVKDSFFDRFIKNQIISNDALMEACFSNNSRLQWTKGYPALYPKGGYTYSAVILDNIHGGFVCKKLLKSVIEQLKNDSNSVLLLFDAMNCDLKEKGNDLGTQLALYKGFCIYFRYKSKNFAFVIPWGRDDACFDQKYSNRPFLIKITKKLENDQPKNWYKTNEYRVVCDDMSVKNAKGDNNDSENEGSIKELIECKAKKVAEAIKEYCEKA